MNRAERRRLEKQSQKVNRSGISSGEIRTSMERAVLLHKSGDLENAEKIYHTVLRKYPNNADALNLLGEIATQRKDLELGEKLIRKSLSVSSKNASTHNNLANLLRAKGDKEGAIKHYRMTLDISPNHTTAQHMLGALTGDKNLVDEKKSQQYIAGLFDKEADIFESLLVDNLKYETPKFLQDMLIKFANENSCEFSSICDLGCGTGLMAEQLVAHNSTKATVVDGVDLSAKMISKAKDKNLYNHLKVGDIVDFIKQSQVNYDLYIAADVLVYLGDLEPLFVSISKTKTEAKNTTKNGAKFLFSTEALLVDSDATSSSDNADGYVITESGRYKHSQKYIDNLLEKYDFKILDYSQQVIREENQQKVMGNLYLVERI